MSDDMSKLRGILQKVDFFYSLSFVELDQLIKGLKKRKVTKGTAIIKQGEPGDAFYMIALGSVSVYIKKGMSEKKAATLGKGDFFGEMALIADVPRNATVYADEQCELFVLYKNDFKKILLANPKISAIMNEVLAKRKSKNAY
jgi:CRP-like cAMP-binding protein